MTEERDWPAMVSGVAPTLSICIATMNRPRELRETLESIVCQTKARDVELIIIDSSSDDASARVVRAFESYVKTIRYSHREASGVDAAYAAAVELASGDVCWLMTDDDVVSSDAISAIVAAAEDGADVVLLNSAVFDCDLREMLEAKRLPISKDRRYSSDEYEQLFRDTANYVSFIGCVVVRRLFWKERFSHRFLGSEFAHVRVIFSGPMKNGAWVLAKPHIRIRYGAAHWTARAFRIWMIQWPSVMWNVWGVSDEARAIQSPREPWLRVRNLLVLRAKGAYGLTQYEELKALMSPNRPIVRLLAWVAAIVPGIAANVLLIAYVRIVRARASDARLALSDFRESPYYYKNYLRHRWRTLLALMNDGRAKD